MTSNMNRAISNVYDRVTTKDKKYNYGIAIYGFIFFFFILGVSAGYAFFKFVPFPETSFWELYKYNFILLVPILCVAISLIINSKYAKNIGNTQETIETKEG